MTGPRTVAAMYGTGIPTEDAPTVTRTILDGGEDYAVDVDLTPAAAVLLEALAAVMDANADLAREWFVLGANRNAIDGRRRAVAVRELLASEPVRRALTIRLTPETADQLRAELDEASLEPYRCGPRGSASPEPGCPRYVEDMGDRCPQHSDPDEVDR
jgi:hypothetical protein